MNETQEFVCQEIAHESSDEDHMIIRIKNLKNFVVTD